MRLSLWVLYLSILVFSLLTWVISTLLPKIQFTEKQFEQKTIVVTAENKTNQTFIPAKNINKEKNSSKNNNKIVSPEIIKQLNKQISAEIEQKTTTTTESTNTKQLFIDELKQIFPPEKLKPLDMQLLADGTIRISNQNSKFIKNPFLVPSEKFAKSLKNFLPTYLITLSQPKYKQKLEAVFIESHTSNQWKNAKSDEERYQKNLILSQQRARSIERFAYQLPKLSYLNKWMNLKLKARGKSFQRPIRTKSNKEISNLSTRIEFHAKFK